MELRLGRRGWCASYEPASGLERECADHLHGTKILAGIAPLARAGKGTGSHGFTQAKAGNGDSLVKTFTQAELETDAILPVEGDDLMQDRPEKCASGEKAASDYRISAVQTFADQPFRDRRRVTLQVDIFG